MILLLFLYSCAPVVLGPPEVDLLPFEKIGIISFSVENARGQLDEIASQFFLEELTRYQRDIQVIELGTLEKVLAKIGKENLDQEALRKIGETFGVRSLFFGRIVISDVKPKIDIGALIRSMRVRASFTMAASCRLYRTKSGATAWTDSALRKGTLAYVHIGKNLVPYFDIRDQDETYKDFVRSLIHRLTRDFRPSRHRGR